MMSKVDPLIAGFERGLASTPPSRMPWSTPRRPHTAVVACSDAGVDPERLFDASPGELYVIRNLGGLVPEYAPDGGCHGTSAALEYAVRVLKVRRVVLLGHLGCDGVHAMINGPLKNAQDFVFPWMEQAETVIWDLHRLEPGRSVQDQLEDDVLRLSYANLLGFPWIQDRVSSGSLKLDAFKHDAKRSRLIVVTLDGRQVAAD